MSRASKGLDGWRRELVCLAAAVLAGIGVGAPTLHAQAEHRHHAASEAAPASRDAAESPADLPLDPPEHRGHSCCPEHGCCAAPAAAGRAPTPIACRLASVDVASLPPVESHIHQRPPYFLPMWLGPPPA